MSEPKPVDEHQKMPTDVRIVYLPPATVAASHFVGPSPERNASIPLDRFVQEIRLADLKPDLRHYGFNHPNPSAERPEYGYEMWVTIPKDLEVPAPLTKKHFAGGLYAAHAIAMGEFEEWERLCCWVRESPRYEENWGDPECMDGLLEEVLDYIHHIGHLSDSESQREVQLDLLLPIRPRQSP